MGNLVVLDGGHGGTDSGAVGNGLLEKDYVLRFTLAVRDALKRCGVPVALTRETDVYVSLSERARFANNIGADYFVSFHLDSNAGTPATGFSSFCQKGQLGTPTDAKRKLVHDEMYAVAAKYGYVNRGYKYADFAVLRETDMSAVLFELFFINNPWDVKVGLGNDYFNDMTEAAARGICKVVGAAYKPPVTTPLTLTQAQYVIGECQRLYPLFQSCEDTRKAMNHVANHMRGMHNLAQSQTLGTPALHGANSAINEFQYLWKNTDDSNKRVALNYSCNLLRDLHNIPRQ